MNHHEHNALDDEKDEHPEFEMVPTPIDIVLRVTSRINSVTVLYYSEISNKGSISGSMEPRHLLAYLRSLFPTKNDRFFNQAAPLTQRDLLRMHHAVSKSDDIVLTVRRHCILFQIDPIKALILADRVILFHDIHDEHKHNKKNEAYKKELVDNLQLLWKKEEKANPTIGMKRSVSTTAVKALSEQNGTDTYGPKESTSTHVPASFSLEISTLDILLKHVLDNLTKVVQDCIKEVRRIHNQMAETFFLPANVAEKIRRVKTQLVRHEHWIQSCHYRLQYLSEDDEEMALMLLSQSQQSHNQPPTSTLSLFNPQFNLNKNCWATSKDDSTISLLLSRSGDIADSFSHRLTSPTLSTRSRTFSASNAINVTSPSGGTTEYPSTMTKNSNVQQDITIGSVSPVSFPTTAPLTPLMSVSRSSVRQVFQPPSEIEEQVEKELDAIIEEEEKSDFGMQIEGVSQPVITRERRMSHGGYDRRASPIIFDNPSFEEQHAAFTKKTSYRNVFSSNAFFNQHIARQVKDNSVFAPNSHSTIVEDLLELYIIELAALAGRVKHHVGLIVNAEETIQLRLSTIENELLLANTNFMLLMCSLSLGMYITGIGGMNLNIQQLADFPHGFTIAAVGSAGIMVSVFAFFKWYFESTGILPARVTKHNSSYHVTHPHKNKNLIQQLCGWPLRRKHLYI